MTGQIVEEQVYRTEDLSAQNHIWPQLLLQVRRNLPAVKTSILNEYLIRSHAGDDDASQVNARNTTLQGLRIHHRLLVIIAAKSASQLADEFEIGMVAGQGKDPIVGEPYFALGSVQNDMVCRNFFYAWC